MVVIGCVCFCCDSCRGSGGSRRSVLVVRVDYEVWRWGGDGWVGVMELYLL